MPPSKTVMKDTLAIHVQEPHYRFGAHQFLWKERWTDDDLPILDAVASLDLSLFEISIGDDISFDRTRVRRHAERNGIELTVGPGNSWPAECDISDDDTENRRRGLAWHKKNIDIASEMGAIAYCGALYGHPGTVRKRPPVPAELPRTAENLHVLAEYAAAHGIAAVIEPMSRFRTHLVCTAERAIELVRMADHENIRINLDTYHMITEERDYGKAIRSILPRIWGIHASESDRGVPGGGLVPWQDVFRALSENNSCTNILFETYNTGGDLGYSRGIFQDLCPDPRRFIRDGAAFLKKMMRP
ncbi:MAG: sugar phosphate isomerase/epimerase family protein [Spirochaetota bacterium]